ncbi:hypothetical protein MKX01_034351 [Papaver californicum]|nr:hypothetical protein MKX01_034351 [Papaver californicum]
MDTQESAMEENVMGIKNAVETEEEDDDGMTLTEFSQRSFITSSNPKSQTTTVVVADPVKEPTGSENKSPMWLTKERAEDIRSSLDPTFPSFVKLMLKSHVTGGFWLHIAKYLAGKCGLSGGWRGFSIAHKLVEGAAVVFQLIKINKFKVYIVRTTGLAEVDGALGLLQLEACAKKSSPGEAGNDMKPTRQPVVGKHPKCLGSTIIVNDLIIDSEMSKHNSFLHKNLMAGLNCKLVAGIISETINIADAIRSSQVSSTSRDEFGIRRKSLEAFEHLGMNVGFLL